MFQFAQRIAEAANRVAAHRSGCDAPFQERFVRTRNCFVVIVIGSSADAGEPAAVDRRNFVDRRAAAAPFAIENARVVVGETQSFQRCFHMTADDSAAIRGAHAARVLVSAARRNELREESSRRKAPNQRKVRESGPLSPAREPRALPGTVRSRFISSSCASHRTCASIRSLRRSPPQ